MLTEKLQKRAVILLGFTIISVAVFLIGPSKLLKMNNSPVLIILGLSVMGFGCGMIIIPVMPEMIESIEEIAPGLNELHLHN